MQVKATTSAYPHDVEREQPEWSGRGRPPAARYRAAPDSLKALVVAAGKRAAKGVTWRERARGSMHSRFVALRVRPANIQLRRTAHDTDAELPVRWLLAEWPADSDQPTDFWLSSLSSDTPLRDLVRLAKLRWRIEHDYRELKDASASTTSKDEVFAAGTTTSPASRSPTPFSPWNAGAREPGRQPEPVRAAARTATPAGPLAQSLPDPPFTTAAHLTPPRPTLNSRSSI